MEKKKRRAHRQSEGDAAATVSLDVAPLPPLSPPRKRAASLACPAPTAPPPDVDVGVLRTDVRISMDRQQEEAGPAMPKGLDEPVVWRGNPIAAAPSPELPSALQRDGDADSNRAVVWSVEQNLPKETFLPRLLRAYESFHDRYTRMKARKVDIEAQFEEQQRSHERFQQVADGYIQDLCSENQELRKIVDAAEKRMKWLESLLQCRKDDELKACKEEVLQIAKNCEADLAASPVRPLIPTENKLAAEGTPVQVAPSEHVREQRGEEVAECRVESSAPPEYVGDREKECPREIEMAIDDEGPQEIVATHQESERLQVLTQENGELRENVVNQGDLEPNRFEGEHHVASPQTSGHEMFDTNQVPKSPVIEPLLGNSLESGRCLEGSAPGDLDKAIVVCSEPVIACPSNESAFQDLHCKKVDFEDLHCKCIELQDLHRKDLHCKNVELQGLHCKYVDLQGLHRKEVAGLLSEVEILQKVFGQFIDMTVESEKTGRMGRDKPAFILLHPKTGFRFRLEILKENEIQLEAAKALELSYKNLSLGTLIGVVPWWMKEEIVFTVDQLVNFLRKFQETITGIPYNRRLALNFGLKF